MHRPSSQETPPSRLAFRCNKKPVFFLSMTSSVECNFSGECVHESTVQRCQTSTFVLDEVRLAFEKVYELLDIMQLYEY
jgi:hypothetical protein